MKFEEMDNETKASMTEEQIQHQVEIELMEIGTRKADHPGDFDLAMPKMHMTTYYNVGSVYFKTQKQAEQFIALQPKKDNYDWRVGSEIRYAEDIEDRVVLVKLCHQDEVNEKGIELIEWNKKHQEWDIRKRRYDSYISSRNSITARIWESWQKAKDAKSEKMEIQATLDEYTELTGGDRELAMTFLTKHFGEEKVKNAIPATAGID